MDRNSPVLAGLLQCFGDDVEVRLDVGQSGGRQNDRETLGMVVKD